MKRALFLALAIMAYAGPAAADDPVAAESLFQEALRFKAQGNYAEACKRFERSQVLAPGVGTLLNLGECHEQLHELAQAWLAYRQAITVAGTLGDKRGDRARTEAARIEPRVPHLTIVHPANAPAGLTITRDGAPIEAAALDVAIAIDPGPHAIAASAPGRRSWQKTVTLAEGQATSVTIPELEAPKHDSRRAIGIGLEIGGGAIFAAGLVAGLVAMSKWSSVEDACPNAGCRRSIVEDQQREVDAARTWATVATVGIIGGAAIFAAGLAFHLTAPKSETQLALAPVVGTETAGLSIVWRR